MSVTLQDEQTICNVGNYGKLNSFVNIERIDRISAKESFYTHLLTVAIDQESVNSVGEKLSLVSFEKPDWLENANDDSGREVTMNMDKTTDKYIKLIVRYAECGVLFNSLTKAQQEEFLSRTFHEEL